MRVATTRTQIDGPRREADGIRSEEGGRRGGRQTGSGVSRREADGIRSVEEGGTRDQECRGGRQTGSGVSVCRKIVSVVSELSMCEIASDTLEDAVLWFLNLLVRGMWRGEGVSDTSETKV